MGDIMAEVRKRVVEDKYNTSKIKIKETKKKEKVKEKKKDTKKIVSKSNENLNAWDKFRLFCSGVKSEFTKVHWTPKNEMIKYSIACIFFIIFCSLFFYLIYILFALVQSWLA